MIQPFNKYPPPPLPGTTIGQKIEVSGFYDKRFCSEAFVKVAWVQQTPGA